jgi:outer membrane protein assembly factor BamA
MLPKTANAPPTNSAWHCIPLAVIGAAGLFAVSVTQAQIQSRAQEIEAARDRKAAVLEPDTPSATEERLRLIKDQKVVERLTAGIAGFRVKFGGLVNGSGFALGPEYLRRDLADGRLLLRAAAQGSFKKYERFDLQFSLPTARGNPYFANFYSVYRNYPGISYYGPGPESVKAARSNFRLEDTQINSSAGMQPVPHLDLGASVGYVLANTGPGGDKKFISTERVFTPAEAPGLDQQTDFFRHSYFAQYDYRDNPGGPRSGGSYAVEYARYLDQDLDRHNYQQLEVHLQQYIPFFNRRRVIALRGRSVLTFQDEDQTVPFYMQQKLGGGDDLRGFRPFRFYDDNMVVVNAEYRWETFSGLDMAVFADAGKVFSRRSQWNFEDLESSVGVGLRFNVRNNVFLRLDAGFSHEGFQVWVKFNNIFAESPVGSPAALAVY